MLLPHRHSSRRRRGTATALFRRHKTTAMARPLPRSPCMAPRSCRSVSRTLPVLRHPRCTALPLRSGGRCRWPTVSRPTCKRGCGHTGSQRASAPVKRVKRRPPRAAPGASCSSVFFTPSPSPSTKSCGPGPASLCVSPTFWLLVSPTSFLMICCSPPLLLSVFCWATRRASVLRAVNAKCGFRI